jgi:hypothetical protein
MLVEEIRSAIMASLVASWATCTVIDLPNFPFSAPVASAWIRPRIKLGKSFVGEIGDDGIGLRTGVIMISVFVPPGGGLKTANGYADRLEKLFKRADIGGARFDEPSTEDLGIDEENGFYHLMVSCDLNAWTG